MILERLEETGGEKVQAVGQKIYDWIKPQVDEIYFGTGKQNAAFIPVLQHGGNRHQLFSIYASGDVEVVFQHMSNKRPFDKEELRIELLNKLNEIDSVNIPGEKIKFRPSLNLAC